MMLKPDLKVELMKIAASLVTPEVVHIGDFVENQYMRMWKLILAEEPPKEEK